MRNLCRVTLALLLLTLVTVHAETPKPPEVLLGKRLFMETRFAQAFFAQSAGDVNTTDISGDAVVANTQTLNGPIPGPFAGKTMNCSACHFHDELAGVPGGGLRAYNDFARRSPIPAREDGATLSLRNSPTLVGSARPGASLFLHFDAEFSTAADLSQGALTGRNMGWLASEKTQAIKHIANVIRKDNGSGDLAKQFGGAYSLVFKADPNVPAAFQLPKQYRLDVLHASDKLVFAAAAKLIGVFLESLSFSRDEQGAFNGSPYDRFLHRNNLPLKPDANETPLAYARRLRDAVTSLATPAFVSPNDGRLLTHTTPFVFGPNELAGLKLFLTEVPDGAPPTGPTGGVGNCITCHTPPDFTDFRFHNVGVTQLEYDGAHGVGAFANLTIPSLLERNANPADALPANALHPDYKGFFRSLVSPDTTGVDLGVWNIFANKDIRAPQRNLKLAAKELFGALPLSDTLNKTIATFKTPGLRDTGHTQPYMHNGTLNDLRQVLGHYARVSDLARRNLLRNPDPKLAGINLTPDQSEQLVRFLNSLNEDFED